MVRSLANSQPRAGPRGPLSRLLPFPLYLVHPVQMEGLATETQEHSQELGAQGRGSNEAPREVGHLGRLHRLTPPSSPLHSGTG